MKKKVVVVGCGAWGTTLAKLLVENNHQVYLWCHLKEVVLDVKKFQENKTFLSNISLPLDLEVGEDFKQVVDADLVVIAVSSSHFRHTLELLVHNLNSKTLVLSATKGLNPSDSCQMSEVIFSLFPENLHNQVGFLSGPNISREIAEQKPATTVIASQKIEMAQKMGSFFHNAYFKVYVSQDIVGTELGGTLKNIIAIAGGVVDGLHLGVNARASLVVRGMVEMVRFATYFGAKKETLFGLSGMGDLITTSSSPLSRNNILGKALAQNVSLQDFLKQHNFVVEGIETCRFVYKKAQKHQIEMPITSEIYQVLFENKSIQEAIECLMDGDSTLE